MSLHPIPTPRRHLGPRSKTLPSASHTATHASTLPSLVNSALPHRRILADGGRLRSQPSIGSGVFFFFVWADNREVGDFFFFLRNSGSGWLTWLVHGSQVMCTRPKSTTSMTAENLLSFASLYLGRLLAWAVWEWAYFFSLEFVRIPPPLKKEFKFPQIYI